MNHGSNGNKFQRQAIAWLNIDIVVSSNHRVPHLQSVRRQNIAPFAIGITQQCNPRRPIRIVFNGLDFGRDIFLVALEIDQAIKTLMPATAMIRGNSAGVVAPAAMLEWLAQAFLRPFLVTSSNVEPGSKAHARGCGPIVS